MSSYKLTQFVSEFIKTRQPGFYFYDSFPNQLYRAMIEENGGENKTQLSLIIDLKRL